MFGLVSHRRSDTAEACTYADQQGRDGGAGVAVDHGEEAGQVALPGSRETQPAAGGAQSGGRATSCRATKLQAAACSLQGAVRRQKH